MQTRTLALLTLLATGFAGCTSDDEPSGGTDGSSSGSSSETGDTSSGGTATTTGSDASTSGSSTSAGTTDASTTDGTGETSEGTTDAGSTGDDTTGGGFAGPGCPDEVPGEWILCEDFETAGGNDTYFGNFWTTANLLAVENGAGLEDGRGLRIGHDPNTFASGVADIRFGQGPTGGMVHEPEGQYRDVWVRFMLRTQEGWPNSGIAEAVEVMSVAGQARAISVDATIYSPSQAEAQAIAWSCVHDSQLLCNGTGDWGNTNLRALDVGLGSTELYGTAAAGQWQCHEIHVRLDDPGAANGEFEVFVDGQSEVSLENLEFVNAWSGAELNNVRFSSFWNAPANLDHYVDDVVVSTAPVGCP